MMKKAGCRGISGFMIWMMFLVFLPVRVQPLTPHMDLAISDASDPAAAPINLTSPVLFIENVGQFEEDARFQAWGVHTATLWFASDAFWVTLWEPSASGPLAGERIKPSLTSNSWPDFDDQPVHQTVSIRVSFLNANLHPQIVPFDRQATRVSYFAGNNPAQWHADVPVWAGIRYVDLYPGVDLVFWSQQGEIKAEFLLSEGSNVEQISLQVDNDMQSVVEQIISSKDMVRLVTEARATDLDVNEKQPPALLRYPLDISSALGIATGRQNGDAHWLFHSELLYSTFVGGNDYEAGNAVVMDQEGNAVLTGNTSSSDFPTTPGAYDPTFSDGEAFVLKLSADGTSLLYSTFLGGSLHDTGESLAVDEAGQVVVTGRTKSSDFPVTPGAFDTSHNGNYDVFVAKLATDGTSLLYGTFLGGGGVDGSSSLALADGGEAVITGDVYSSDFPTTPGAYDTSYGGGGDVFVSKLATDGSALLYSTFLGGSSSEIGSALALDSLGQAVITGYTGSSNFPTTPGVYDASFNGGFDAFVLKLTADGSSLVYSTFVGTAGSDSGSAIALDGSGQAVVAGSTDSSDFPFTPGAYDTTYNGNGDAFLVKLAPDASLLVFSTFLGGSQYDWPLAVALDNAEQPVVVGDTESVDFPATPGAYDTTFNGGYADAFVSRLAADGSSLQYSTFVGGSETDVGKTLTLDDASHVVMTGATGSTDFPTTPGAYDESHNGLADCFVFVLTLPPLAPTLYPIDNPEGGGDYLVDWSDASGVTDYTLEEDDSLDFPSPLVRYTGSESLFQVTDQAAGTWYYRVRATNAGGDGPWSNIESTAVKPDAPVLLPISNPDGDESYLVNWTAVPGADLYTLQEADEATFATPVVRYSGPDDDYQIDDQIAGTWFYRVCASNAGGDSPWSNTQLVSVIPGAPILWPIQNPDGNGEYLIDWEDATGALGYVLEEDDNLAFLSPETRYIGSSSQYQMTGQPVGSWYYRVLASNAGGNSPWSNVESVAVSQPSGPYRIYLPAILRSE